MSMVVCKVCGVEVPVNRTELTGRGSVCDGCAARAEIEVLSGRRSRVADHLSERDRAELLTHARRAISVGLTFLGIALVLGTFGVVMALKTTGGTGWGQLFALVIMVGGLGVSSLSYGLYRRSSLR